MGLPKKLPCICTNQECGHQFYAPNLVGGDGGRNFSFVGNMTICPKCRKPARYADWSTDSQGNFHLHGFFNYFRKIESIEKLQNIKAELEAANDAVTATELADTLSELDENFSKFRNAVTAIPPSAIKDFIQTLIMLITLVVMIQTWQSSEEHHDENITINKKQQELAEKQFEYQKDNDIKNGKNEDELEDLKRRILELESDFERKLNEIQKHNDNIKPPSRNSPCTCGSGKRYKNCCGTLI